MLTSAFVSTFLLAVSVLAHPHGHGGPSSDQLYSFLKSRTTAPAAAAEEGAAVNPAAETGGSANAFSAARFPDVQTVLDGNKRFVKNRDANAIQELVDNGQKPPFMMVACSDSRAPEATIFDSKPGTFFMERNIANQYKPGDENAQSVMAYGIHVLGVQHIVILGHYGCGGIAASIATPPKNNINVASHIVNTWIGDIRQLYLSSNRSEIVEMRTANLAIEAAGGAVEEPKIREPGFRALVEENVKLQVTRLVESSVMKNRVEEIATKLNKDGTPKASSSNSNPVERRAEEGGAIRPVFVHGWVHDLESGEIIDLNISSGPAGFENFVPPTAGEGNAESPSTTTTASGESATSTSAAEGATSSSSPAAEGEASTTTTAVEGGATSSSVPVGEGAASSTSVGAESAAASPASNGDVRVHGPSSLGTRKARRSNSPRALKVPSVQIHKRSSLFGRIARR